MSPTLFLHCSAPHRTAPHHAALLCSAAAKRQRLGGPAGADAALLREVPAWVEALDEPCSIALFEKALFHHLEDAIQGRPDLRDMLLTAYVQRQ